MVKGFEIPEEIAVGIHTVGIPRLVSVGDGLTRLENMLIGKDFHWQRELSVVLPGRVVSSEERKGKKEVGEVINFVPLERYLECVVGSEMNPEAPVEFLKAHAIISRSWAVGKILGIHPEDNVGRVDTTDCLIGWDDTAAHKGFHVCSDDHCQRYQGVQPVAPEVLEAIRATSGIVLTDLEGYLIDARFSKCCGGNTEVFSTCWQDREMPGLESFDDPWCDIKDSGVLRVVLKDYDLSTKGGYRWVAFVSKDEIACNLREKFGRNVGKVLSIEAVERGPSGRIKLLRVIGDESIVLLGKELWIRRLLSPTHLYSSAVEIEDCGDEVKLVGRGWGHGVGLCQIGAARMALEGASCEEILHFYYPNTRLYKKEGKHR